MGGELSFLLKDDGDECRKQVVEEIRAVLDSDDEITLGALKTLPYP
jgi:hypothetical protein